MGRPDLALTAPVRIGISIDQKNPDRYDVIITQSGLGLPDRDYYLKDDAVYAALLAKYLAHITRLLALIGERQPDAEAQAILELETRIARVHWPAAKRRERDLTYNPRTRVELEAMAPGFFWETLLATEGVDAQPQFVVRETDAVQSLAQLFLQVPLQTWRAYFKYHYLVSVASVLPHAFDEEVFDLWALAAGPAAASVHTKRAVRAWTTT
jgi:predicted metalloendopeptidase